MCIRDRSYIDNWKDYHSGVAVLSFTNVASNEIHENAQTIHGSLGELGYPDVYKRHVEIFSFFYSQFLYHKTTVISILA